MKVLLTGHEGFIGKNIHIKLSEMDDVEEIILIEKSDADRFIVRQDKLEELVKASDVILHNGAISATDNENYKEIMHYNVFFSKILINLAHKHDKTIVFASSASVYGAGDDYPQNLYAWSKMITEDYGRAKHPYGFTSLRYFNVYGPHEEHKDKMSSVAYQAWLVKHGTFKLFPREPRRDFVYVNDVVSANIAAIEAPCGVYDVGLGVANRFEDLVSNMGVKFDYVDQSKIPDWYQFFTESNPSKWLPNWSPKYTLELGCEDYLKYLKYVYG